MFLERDSEMEKLESSLRMATSGRGNICLVTGEAGAGKTTLLENFRTRNPRVNVAWAICDTLLSIQPLGTIYDLARGLSLRFGQELPHGASLSDVTPIVLDRLQELPSAILVIEDIHWADNGTLDFIRFIGRRISLLGVQLILSYRQDEIPPDHPLQSVLGDLNPSYLNRIPINPLSKEAVRRLAADTPANAETVFQITNGNAFFVTEFLAASQAGAADVPQSVREAVNARLNRLSTAERNFLEISSLLTGPIHPALFRPIIPDADILAYACVGRNFLTIDNQETLRFRHDLARLATAQRSDPRLAKERHAQILRLLLDQPEEHSKAQILYHAAKAQDHEVVLQYVFDAANDAAQVGGHREAASHLATALEFVDNATTEQTAFLYEKWAYEAGLSLQINDDVIEARHKAIALWEQLGRTERIAHNLRWLSRLHWYRGEAQRANHYADQAVSLLENAPPSQERALAFSLKSQRNMLNGKMEEAIEWGQKALDAEPEPGTAEVRIHALNNIGTAKLFRGDVSGLSAMEESLKLAQENGLHEDAARVYTNLAEYAVEFKDFQLADKVIDEGIRFDTDHDLDSWTYYLVGRLAQLRLEQGRFTEAITIADSAIQRKGQTLLMQLPAKIVRAKAQLRMGNDNAYDSLQEALDGALSTEEIQYTLPVISALFEYHWYKEHYCDLDPLFSHLPENGEQSSEWVSGELAFFAHCCGIPADQLPAAKIAKPYLAALDGEVRKGGAMLEKLGSPYAAATVYVTGASKESLEKAAELSRELKAKPLLIKIKKIAKTHGFGEISTKVKRGPYGAAKNHPLGLTAKEQKILMLISDGSSNQEIAQHLSRSRRTIEHHVSSVLSKLGVSSRLDALVRLQNEPWILSAVDRPAKIDTK